MMVKKRKMGGTGKSPHLILLNFTQIQVDSVLLLTSKFHGDEEKHLTAS